MTAAELDRLREQAADDAMQKDFHTPSGGQHRGYRVKESEGEKAPLTGARIAEQGFWLKEERHE